MSNSEHRIIAADRLLKLHRAAVRAAVSYSVTIYGTVTHRKAQAKVYEADRLFRREIERTLGGDNA